MHPRLRFFLAASALVIGLLGSLRGARADYASDSGPLLEEPRARQGYWVGVGVSGIGAQLWEHSRSRGVYSGYTGTLRLGQLITRRLGLGLLVEYIGGVGKGSDKGSIGGITIEGSCLLVSNLSLHGGFGVGYVMLSDPNALDTSLRGGGGSYLELGASYDLFPLRKRLSGGWALTPVVDVHLMPDGNIKFLAVMAGLQITWWSGLPNNMLHLPED